MHYVFVCIFMYVYVFMCHGMPVEIRGLMGLLPPVLRTPKPSLLLRALVLLFSVKAFGLQSHLPKLCLPLTSSALSQWVWVSNILSDTACPGKLLGFQPLLVWTLTRESRPPWISSTTEFRTPFCQPAPQRRQSNCRSWELFLLSPDLQSWNSLANWPGSQLIIASRQMCEASQGCWRLTGKFYLFWSYFWCIREMWY